MSGAGPAVSWADRVAGAGVRGTARMEPVLLGLVGHLAGALPVRVGLWLGVAEELPVGSFLSVEVWPSTSPAVRRFRLELVGERTRLCALARDVAPAVDRLRLPGLRLASVVLGKPSPVRKAPLFDDGRHACWWPLSVRVEGA